MRRDPLALLLDGVLRAVDARLDVQRARRGDEERHVAGRDELHDVLAHLLARDEEVLADVGQPVVAGGVGVVADHRDLRRQRLVGRAVERLEVDEAHPDAVRLGRDRAVERVDHLVDVAALRARPLVAAAQQLARVLGAVLRRHEERVRRDVVDQDELQLRLRAEDAGGGRARGRGRRGARRGRLLAAAAGVEDEGGHARCSTGQRGAPGHVPPPLVRRVLLLAVGPLEAFDHLVGGIKVRPLNWLVRHL